MIPSFALLTNQPLFLILIFSGCSNIYSTHFRLTMVSFDIMVLGSRGSMSIYFWSLGARGNRYTHQLKLVGRTRQKHSQPVVSQDGLLFIVEISAPLSASVLRTFYYN